MGLSESADKLKVLIDKAIEDKIITPEEFDQILNLVHEDGYIDKHERKLIESLYNMVETKQVRLASIYKN